MTGVFHFPHDFLPQAHREQLAGTGSHSSFVSGSENWKLQSILERLLTHTEDTDTSSVATEPSRLVTFFGPPGSGKSTILYGIQLCVSARYPSQKIIFSTADDLARSESLDVCECLIVDDIHQLCGRISAQRKLIRSMDEARDHGEIVVLASRSHPATLPAMAPELVSRLMGGHTIQIEAPSKEARSVIARQYAREAGWELSDDAAHTTSELFQAASIRELRHSLARCFPVRPSDEPNSNEISAANLLERLAGWNNAPISPAEVKKRVARHYSVAVTELKSASRRRNVVLARSVAIYLIREVCEMPFKRIGELFGGRDHTTVIHAYNKIKEQLNQDTELHQVVSKIMIEVRGAKSN